MFANFDIETARNSSPAYRSARLALLRPRLNLTFEQTDVSAQEVEDALTRFAEDMDGRERQPIEPYWC